MKFVHKMGFVLLGAIFALVALLCLGALAEDNAWIANILNYMLRDDIVTIIFAYIALKSSYFILLKVGVISSWISLLLWNEIVAAGSLRTLFHFSNEEVIFHHRRSFDYEIRKVFPILNSHTILEDKIHFSMNIVSVIIAIVEGIKTAWVYGVNSLFLLLQKRNKSEMLLNKMGFDIFRFFKGIVVLICELIVIPLKLIEPLTDLPYWILYFLVVVLPDFLTKIFRDNRHAKPVSGDNFNAVHSANIEQGRLPMVIKNNASYIHKKLEESMFDSEF